MKQQETTNASRLGAGFISVFLETRWLGHFGGFYVPEPYCIHTNIVDYHGIQYSVAPFIKHTHNHGYTRFDHPAHASVVTDHNASRFLIQNPPHLSSTAETEPPSLPPELACHGLWGGYDW